MISFSPKPTSLAKWGHAWKWYLSHNLTWLNIPQRFTLILSISCQVQKTSTQHMYWALPLKYVHPTETCAFQTTIYWLLDSEFVSCKAFGKHSNWGSKSWIPLFNSIIYSSGSAQYNKMIHTVLLEQQKCNTNSSCNNHWRHQKRRQV